LDHPQNGDIREWVECHITGRAESRINARIVSELAYVLVEGARKAQLVKRKGPELIYQVPYLLDVPFDSTRDLIQLPLR
jgi:hypothetical protein